MTGKLTQLKLTSSAAIRIIRDAADGKTPLLWSAHARMRMRQRKINTTQAVSCLKLGVLVEGPALDIKGGWRCTLSRRAAGEEVQVAVSILMGPSVVVVTVM